MRESLACPPSLRPRNGGHGARAPLPTLQDLRRLTPSLRAQRSNPSRRAKKEWIASSQLLLAMTLIGQKSAFSRRDSPEVCREVSRLEIRGRRECRMRAAPAVPCAKWEKKTHTSIQVQRRHSDIPCAMALRITSSSPRRIGLVCLRRLRIRANPRPVGPTGLRRLDANH
jgi:hypothetical protein